MATIPGNIVEADPMSVAGTFDAKDVRLALIGNMLPGLFASGDFAASQRAAGANLSMDIAQGRAFIDPQSSTHQGVYLTRRTNATAYNTLADGGITWTASDPTNPRIDLMCMQLVDNVEDASGATGSRFVLVTGTPSASITHQLDANFWPTIPTGYLPLHAVLRPATSTTITTSQISNLNAIGGVGRSPAVSNAATETTTTTTYTRLATPDFVCAYVPSANARVRIGYRGQWKGPGAGTQGAAIFINGVQMKWNNGAGGVPVVQEVALSVPATLAYITSVGNGLVHTGTAATDVSDVSTGQAMGWNAQYPDTFDVFGIAAGWYVFETRFKTSTGTLTAQNRRMWAEVIG